MLQHEANATVRVLEQAARHSKQQKLGAGVVCLQSEAAKDDAEDSHVRRPREFAVQSSCSEYARGGAQAPGFGVQGGAPA